MKWFLLLVCTAAGGAEILGTDLLEGAFSTALTRAAGSPVAAFGGTLPARRALAEGQAGAVVLLRRPGEVAPVVPQTEIWEFPLASAAVIVAAHLSNRVERLTLEQLADAFARDARSPARNWNDLDPAARSELMTPVVCSPAGTLALEIFQGIVLEGQPFRADVRLRVEPALAADLLSARSGTLVLMPRAQDGRGRVIPIADGRPGRPSTAYTPSPANIQNGDYPLQLPLVLYVRADRVGSLRPALRWLCSDEAAEILLLQGLHPASAAARGRVVQRLDTR